MESSASVCSEAGANCKCIYKSRQMSYQKQAKYFTNLYAVAAEQCRGSNVCVYVCEWCVYDVCLVCVLVCIIQCKQTRLDLNLDGAATSQRAKFAIVMKIVSSGVESRVERYFFFYYYFFFCGSEIFIIVLV